MRSVQVVLAVLGLAVAVWFAQHVGAVAIAEALGRLAWWHVPVVCLPFAVIAGADTLGWRFAFARDRASFARLYGARLAGEALNVVTVIGSVGGEAVKAWLIRRDVAYGESVPAVVIAKTTATIAQFLFLLAGAALAWAAPSTDGRVLAALVRLAALEALAVTGFVAVQVLGVVGRLGRTLATLGMIAGDTPARDLDAALRGFYCREGGRLFLSTACHLAGWLLGTLEVLVILACLGTPATLGDATVIEALGGGVRFATFLVPASLGALEGANAAAFEAMGFGAGAGLAFSLVRRARQLVWVAIGMLTLAAMGRRPARHRAPLEAAPTALTRRPALAHPPRPSAR